MAIAIGKKDSKEKRTSIPRLGGKRSSGESGILTFRRGERKRFPLDRAVPRGRRQRISNNVRTFQSKMQRKEHRIRVKGLRQEEK